MSAPESLVAVQDIDLLLEEAADRECARESRRLGVALTAEAVTSLVAERRRLTQSIDRRWLELYERCRARYGRGLTGVRDRTCLGCQARLPTSNAPTAGIALLQACESCGRLLLWV